MCNYSRLEKSPEQVVTKHETENFESISESIYGATPQPNGGVLFRGKKLCDNVEENVEFG